MLRWYAGPALILLGLALLFLVGCAPRLALEGGLPRVEIREQPGCVYRVGTTNACWACIINSWGDDVMCDYVHIGPVIEWRL